MFLAIAIAAASAALPPALHRVDSPAGGIEYAGGTLSEPLIGDVGPAALRWALQHKADLGVPETSTLALTDTFGTRFGASYALQQHTFGLDVYGAAVVVTVDFDRRVSSVASSAINTNQVDPRFVITSEGALRLAGAQVPYPALRENGVPFGGTRKVFFPRQGALHAGYVVHVITIDRTKNYLAAIDAIDGAVLWVQNRVFNAADDANVYASSPGPLDSGVGVKPTVGVKLKSADGGVLVSSSYKVFAIDGGFVTLTNDAGYLHSARISSFNCCPNQSCKLDAGAMRLAGHTSYAGLMFDYDSVACDRVQRASNNVALHDAGSYVYAPIDPPLGGTSTVVAQTDPAYSDEFSEVHAFVHINSVYDWVEGLSRAANPSFSTPLFQMRDNNPNNRTPTRTVTVWSNITFPDYNEITQNNPLCVLGIGACTVNKLLPIDNAAFLPREALDEVVLPPGYFEDTDQMMIFQGSQADFGYDAPVLWHEFGHGVITSTANILTTTVAIDNRSANNEGGAIHEGFADYFAAAFGKNPNVGEYVGPRISGGGTQTAVVRPDATLRSLAGDFKCPDVLWGEVHEDSQHLSSAIWKVRNQFFLGSDNGATFDAAFYAALVSLPSNAKFATVASALAAKVGTAFATVDINAAAKVTAELTARGVIGCSKVLDVTNATQNRAFYALAGQQSAGIVGATSIVPGPIQFKIMTPNGASSVSLQATAKSGSLIPTATASAVDVRLLVKDGAPITFTQNGSALSNDATIISTATVNPQGAATATAIVNVPCGSTSAVYMTLGTAGGAPVNVTDLKFTFQPLASCNATTDSGTPDAGDAGNIPLLDAGTDAGSTDGGDTGGPGAGGCGCTSGADASFLLLGLLPLVRRRRFV